MSARTTSPASASSVISFGVTLLALAAQLTACESEIDLLEIAEPIYVYNASFQEGEISTEVAASATRITTVESFNSIYVAGQAARTISGRTTLNAYAVAVQVEGAGSGYFVVPVFGINPAIPEERDFAIQFDVGGVLPAGLYTLRFAALDSSGEAGQPFDLDICLADEASPDNLNACDTTSPPPAAAVTLTWDTDSDIDLVLLTDRLKRVDSRSPSAAIKPSDAASITPDVLADPAIGRLVRDSNAECQIDGRNSESFVWQEAPASGAYQVYANLFDACQTTGARFVLTEFHRVDNRDGTFAFRQVNQLAGQLNAIQANGNAGAPIYLATVRFPLSDTP